MKSTNSGKYEMLSGRRIKNESPEVRVTGGQKLWTQISGLTLQTSVQISSQKESFLATPNVENKFEVLVK